MIASATAPVHRIRRAAVPPEIRVLGLAAGLLALAIGLLLHVGQAVAYHPPDRGAVVVLRPGRGGR